jgi:death on curing protein
VKEPKWISREEALVLHELMLRRFGGFTGVRDSAALDEAIARPGQLFASGMADMPTLAACYATGFALGRPFVSGNLGSAIAIPATFLRCNGLVFTGKEEPLVETMLELARGQCSEAFFARYLQCNCRAR